ncbi:hypothetical protein NDU88_002141 [Pleurodeles waltl]|uniref:Uncharacterized protein n=1 Tax=Pleurodeles waltl TaxID=8319 RepID=A0AAV7PD81_PLEWA|nr:hypothetical protein NDU88_002141 [Pleurodeles waltl]
MDGGQPLQRNAEQERRSSTVKLSAEPPNCSPFESSNCRSGWRCFRPADAVVMQKEPEEHEAGETGGADERRSGSPRGRNSSKRQAADNQDSRPIESNCCSRRCLHQAAPEAARPPRCLLFSPLLLGYVMNMDNAFQVMEGPWGCNNNPG